MEREKTWMALIDTLNYNWELRRVILGGFVNKGLQKKMIHLENLQ